MISEGCEIYGEVVNSILSGGVRVDEGAKVYDSVIMDDVVIKSGAVVNTAIIDSEVTVLENAKVGSTDKSDITVIGKGKVIKAKEYDGGKSSYDVI